MFTDWASRLLGFLPFKFTDDLLEFSGPPRRASILPLTPETQVRMMLA